MHKTIINILGLLLVSSVVWTASINMPDLGIIPKATGSRPTGGEGDLFTDSTTHRLQYKDNSAWYNLIGPATTDTLTNKTLSGNIAASLQSGTGTITFNTNGAITVPNGTDTLVGRATTDTLTNKSISGSTNTLTNIPMTSATGTLPIANGGTNNGSLSVTNGGIPYLDGSKFVAVSPASASGAILFSNSTTGVPAWGYGTYQAKTSAYTLTGMDSVVKVDSSGGAFNLTLPSAVTYPGKEYSIKSSAVGVNAGVGLATTGGQTISGLASANIILNTVGDSIRIVSDGTNWQVIDWGIYVGAYYTGQPTGTINGSTDNIFPTKTYGDPNGDYATGTGLYTVRYSGYYDFSTQAFITLTAGSFLSVAASITSGAVFCISQLALPSNISNSITQACSAQGVHLNAGNTVQVRFNANGSPAFSSSTPGYSFFSIKMVRPRF